MIDTGKAIVRIVQLSARCAQALFLFPLFMAVLHMGSMSIHKL